MERIKKNLRTVLLALCGVMLFLLPAQSVRAALFADGIRQHDCFTKEKIRSCECRQWLYAGVL